MLRNGTDYKTLTQKWETNAGRIKKTWLNEKGDKIENEYHR